MMGGGGLIFFFRGEISSELMRQGRSIFCDRIDAASHQMRSVGCAEIPQSPEG